MPTLDHNLGGARNSSAVNSLTMSPSSAVPIGDLLVVYGWVNGTGTTFGVADTGSNTYNGLFATSSHPAVGGIWVARITSALTTSSVITFSFGSSGSCHMSAQSFTGLDANAAALGLYGLSVDYPAATNVPSISTSTSVNAGHIVVAFLRNGTSFTITQPGTWAALSYLSSSGAVGGGWFSPTSNGVVTYAPTTNSSQTYDTAIAAFPTATALSVTESPTTSESVPKIPLPSPIAVIN